MQAYGWSSHWEAQFRQVATSGQPGRVMAEHRDRFVVRTAVGEQWARVAGRLRHGAQSRVDLPAVGDWVVVQGDPDGTASIAALLPRRSVFVRRAAGDEAVEQVVGANIDVVWIVTALGRDVNPRRVERYLALAWESGARPVVVLTKADLSPDPSTDLQRLHEVAVGIPVHLASAMRGDGLDELKRYLTPEVTVALLGSSGVGKSTLVNALAGEEVLATASVRTDGKGRHTTTSRQLVPLPGGGVLLDTPGMRELGLWEAGEGVSLTFADVEALSANCRFRDCRHRGEPGCAVTAAVENGTLDASRLDAYHKLRAELAYLASKVDPALSREREHQARVEHRRYRKILKRKRMDG